MENQMAEQIKQVEHLKKEATNMNPELQEESRQPLWLEAVSAGDNNLDRLEKALIVLAEKLTFILKTTPEAEEPQTASPLPPYGSSDLMVRFSSIIHKIDNYANLVEVLTKRIDI